MISKVEESKDTIVYHIDSIGCIEVKKNYIYKELISYPVVKISEDSNSITYRMPDDNTCVVSKSIRIPIIEVLIRYYLLKVLNINKVRNKAKANG